MNSVQLHLGLTHVPVILTLTALVILFVGISGKNSTTIKIANIIFVLAALFNVPVYLSGEGAEEVAEKITGVSETLIESHEEIAKFSLIAVILTGFAALASLIFQNRNSTRAINILTLVAALAASGLFVRTAHLGGMIRHTELSGNVSAVSVETEDEEHDDD